MTRRFKHDLYDGHTKCAVPSCGSPNPRLYDERTELSFCDMDCLAEYIAENPEDVAEWYAKLNVYVNE